jgi:beta-D-xylosidase 4
MQSNYHGTAPYFISPAQGLLNYTKSVNLVPGLQATGDKSTTGIAAAAAAAAKAEVTIIVAGMSEAQEGEGHDRTDLELPGAQAELISTVTKAAKGKVILVVMSGGPVDLSAAKADPKIAAILIVGYPGQAGGLAIAETLFGDNPPAGKLTQTWYKASYAEQCHMTDMNMRPETKPEFPGWPVCIGRTYRFFKGDPVFKFGDGLSYTTFTHSVAAVDGQQGGAAQQGQQLEEITLALTAEELNAHIQETRYRPHQAPTVLSVAVDVANTGLTDSDETLLAYAVPPHAGQAGAPIRSLRRYERVAVASGAVERVVLEFTAHDLAMVDETGAVAAMAGGWTLELGQARMDVRVLA